MLHRVAHSLPHVSVVLAPWFSLHTFPVPPQASSPNQLDSRLELISRSSSINSPSSLRQRSSQACFTLGAPATTQRPIDVCSDAARDAPSVKRAAQCNPFPFIIIGSASARSADEVPRHSSRRGAETHLHTSPCQVFRNQPHNASGFNFFSRFIV